MPELQHQSRTRRRTERASRSLGMEKSISMFMRTLVVAAGWLDKMPQDQRLPPLLTLCMKLLQVICTPPIDLWNDRNGSYPAQPSVFLGGVTVGGAPQGNSAIPEAFLIGDVYVYSKLLAFLPSSFLESMIHQLDKFCPAFQHHQDSLGFRGRPGRMSRQRQRPSSDNQSVPWTDTIADVRAVMSLLLLHVRGTQPFKSSEADENGVRRTQDLCLQFLDDADVRVRYFASRFLLKRYMHSRPAQYQQALRHIIVHAQQMNDERLIDNPYLQVKNLTHAEVAGL